MTTGAVMATFSAGVTSDVVGEVVVVVVTAALFCGVLKTPMYRASMGKALLVKARSAGMTPSSSGTSRAYTTAAT